ELIAAFGRKYTPEGQGVLDKLKAEGRDISSLDDEEAAFLRDNIRYALGCIEIAEKKMLPLFTSAKELVNFENAENVDLFYMPLSDVISFTDKEEADFFAVVINVNNGPVILPWKWFFDKDSGIPEIEIQITVGENEATENEPPETVSTPAPQKDLPLSIDVERMDVFNYALYQNNVAPIRGVRILNSTGDPVSGLTLKITSDHPFFAEYHEPLPEIPSGKPVQLSDPVLRINGRVLAEMTESEKAAVSVELCRDGQPVDSVRGRMLVLAYDQWQGGTYTALLPSFVLPNHPLIPVLMNDAGEILKKWKKPIAFEGYQSRDPNRVRDLAAAAYGAIQKRNIRYAEPPASFSVAGQRIRTPETIMKQGLGTCMDMTLLYAALLEAIGLHCLLVLLRGHIFAGIWLRERTREELMSGNVVIDDYKKLIGSAGAVSEDLTFVECTAMCSGKNTDFEEAEIGGKMHLADPSAFESAIDVFLSRGYGIRPIPPRQDKGGSYSIDIKEKDYSEITAAPRALEISVADVTKAAPRKKTGKKELWESKLLDLSDRNMLLDLPLNASVEPVMSSHIDELEDALSDGHEFNLLPAPEWIAGLEFIEEDKNGKRSKPKNWLSEAIKRFGVYETVDWPRGRDIDLGERFRQEFRNHRLYTFCSPGQLERSLTSIYRSTRSAQQENGVSSLYLAVGLLRWFMPGTREPNYAPLILVPIEIVRKSANLGYALHARAEEPHFNLTLLEMLKQNFNLEIPGLEPLPGDEHGTDINKVFSIVRGAVFAMDHWNVVESCVIGNFSFAQFAMWNDIHNSENMLEKSKIVRSLMKGRLDWDTSKAPDLDKQFAFLPITVDDTQQKAIKMAAAGETFVLHGPPGTGKSQTITGMIANLLAHRKTVLFVAEKKAALSVVQKRLAALGLGDFCLELHSDKANKKQVLSQLEKALVVTKPAGKPGFEENIKTMHVFGKKLDAYSEHLHKKQQCGMSLRELIALYETVRDEEHTVVFAPEEAGKLTEEDIRSHSALLGQLTAAGGAVGDIANSPLKGVGLRAFNADVRSSIGAILEGYEAALKKMAEPEEIPIPGISKPQNFGELEQLKKLLEIFEKEADPLLMKLSEAEIRETEGYYEKLEQLNREKSELLETWDADFLKADMQDFLARHEAAGKKLFGKGAAKSQITSEIQSRAKRQMSYEEIPGLLWKIIAWQKNEKELLQALETLPENVRAAANKYPAREAFGKALDQAVSCRREAEEFPGGIEAVAGIAGDAERSDALKKLASLAEGLYENKKAADELLVRSASPEDSFEKELRLCGFLLKNPAVLKDWGIYNGTRGQCLEAGLAPAVEAYENGLPASSLETACRKGLYFALINYIISHNNYLSNFSGATFNEAVARYKKMDDIMLGQTKQEIIRRLSANLPSPTDSPEAGQELNLLRKAIGSNARGMSVRVLFERIPHILQRLCPCMLMSPNSVAQYLAQKNDLFDVVIFDEASQLPTCKAVGALARGKDAVIVGDPKQMPPTSFFSGAGPETDDLALADLDSILDDALALGIPSQYLKWHYRSAHESLIAFSNKQFYENKMFTFPSANDRERHVKAVYVDGVYTKNTNPAEAEAVVAEIIR
ncbi:MAG: DUF4011 domain-containing protein, partial [Abditibacteriota bacterium]|nr:DUF4011 domain-containing protein [Abditibacteriota bacterium]